MSLARSTSENAPAALRIGEIGDGKHGRMVDAGYSVNDLGKELPSVLWKFQLRSLNTGTITD
jgi:hypothetical protein